MATTPDLIVRIVPDVTACQRALAEAVLAMDRLAFSLQLGRGSYSRLCRQLLIPVEVGLLSKREDADRRRVERAMRLRARRAVRRGRRAAARAARERSR